MKNTNFSLIKAYEDNTIAKSQELIQKLFSVVKNCSVCSAKLKENVIVKNET